MGEFLNEQQAEQFIAETHKSAGIEIENITDVKITNLEVEGEPLTVEKRIIAALVRKLGGSVELDTDEIYAEKGFVVHGSILEKVKIEL